MLNFMLINSYILELLFLKFSDDNITTANMNLFKILIGLLRSHTKLKLRTLASRFLFFSIINKLSTGFNGGRKQK